MIDLPTTGVNVTAIAGAVAWVYGNFTTADDYIRHVAESRTGTVQQLRRDLRENPGDQITCDVLERELAAICLDTPDHPFCKEQRKILDAGGCT